MKRLTVTLALLLSSLAFAQHPHGAPSGRAKGETRMGQGVADMMPVASEFDFIRGMTAHHQEAVDSARVVLNNTERPELREFAAGVINVQEREIETLRRWLGVWYPDAPEKVSYTPMMRTLPNATPDEADRAFIKDMVAHHRMAVDMSKRFLAATFEKRPETEALARDIIATQTAEVDLLRGWLREWYSAYTPVGGHKGH